MTTSNIAVPGRNLVEIPKVFYDWAKRHSYSEKSINKYKYMFATFWEFTKKTNTAIEDVSPLIITEFTKKQLNDKKAKTKLSYLWLINDFFYDMVEDGLIEVNPVTSLLEKLRRDSRGKQPKRLPLVLSQFERKQFMAYIDALPRNYHGMLIRCSLSLLLHTGLRAEELCSLEINNLHLEDETAWLYITGKFSKERTVPIPDEIVNDLIEFIELQDETVGKYLIKKEGTGKTYTPNGIYYMVKTALSRADIVKRRMSPHILRHTFATTALIAGNGIEKVQMWLGHDSIASTNVYLSFVQSIDGIKTVA